MDGCLTGVPSNTTVDELGNDAGLEAGEKLPEVFCLPRVRRSVQENSELLCVSVGHDQSRKDQVMSILTSYECSFIHQRCSESLDRT